MVTIYTDGGCHGNPGPGGWGYVILADGEFVTKNSGGDPLTTNNKMELSAVIEALHFCMRQHITEVEVNTDSQYVKNGITQWIHSWKRNGWKTASKGAVKNKEYWVELDALVQQMKIDWHWVKGHAGVEWNEVCDELTQVEIARFE